MIHYYNVKKTYKSGVEALRGVSFEIETGEFVFVIGKSGSGKSTLLKCMTKEEDPTEGKVTIDNFDITHMSRALIPVLRRNIGMIYQDFRLIDSKTVEENIAFVGEVVGIPKKNLAQSVRLVLNVVGLKDKADAYPQELSGGEQQRVAIARAMVNNPKLIVADEPTGNLDPETSESIMALLLEINKSGTTVIVCTHDSNMVDRMKKRVIEVEGGRIVRDEYASSYSSEEESAPAPISGKQLREAGYDLPEEVSFGDEMPRMPLADEPAFSEDSDYSDDYDDEDYARRTVKPVPMSEVLKAVEAKAPAEEEKVSELPFFEEAPASAPVSEPVQEQDTFVENEPEPESEPVQAPSADFLFGDEPAPSARESKKLQKEEARKKRQEEKQAAKLKKVEKKNKVRPVGKIPDLDILEDDE